jgi:hypothetical protein
MTDQKLRWMSLVSPAGDRSNRRQHADGNPNFPRNGTHQLNDCCENNKQAATRASILLLRHAMNLPSQRLFVGACAE